MATFVADALKPYKVNCYHCIDCVQYLSKKNIKVFLDTCRSQFGLKDADLFQILDLFEARDIAKVKLSFLCVSSVIMLFYCAAMASQNTFP